MESSPIAMRNFQGCTSFGGDANNEMFCGHVRIVKGNGSLEVIIDLYAEKEKLTSLA